MKTNKWRILRLKFLLGIFVLAVLSSSCARKMSFGISPVVPAAEGKVKVKKEKNNNYNISISVQNLAPAERLTPPKKTYIVWMVGKGNTTKNIGQLKSSGSFMSKKLKADLKTVSSVEPDYFFITAEDDTQPAYPGATVVLSTKK